MLIQRAANVDRGKTIPSQECMARRYPRASLLIEESPISLGLIQALRQENVSVVAIKPSKDKQSRVISQTDRFEAGSVFLPERADWLDSLVGELPAFPAGRHDR